MIVSILFAAIGLIILLGFVGSYFFKRTMVPDILWLLMLGVMLGPMFNVVDPNLLVNITPFLSAAAIMIILFQGGIQTNIYTLIKQSSKSLLLASLSIGLSMIACAAFGSYVLGWPVMNGLLLGAILGGSSSPIIISLTNRLPMKDDIKALLNIESTLTDAFCIIIAIVIVELMVLGNYSAIDAATSLVSTFSIGATIGFLGGIIWIGGLSRLRGKEFEYMLVLSILLLLYAFVESINGSGAIAAFVFGVVLANSKDMSRMLRLKKRTQMHTEVGRFHNEISFLVRTFFFLYLGMIVTFNSMFIIYAGIALAAVLLVMRFVAVYISTAGMDFSRKEKNVMGVLMPRGLAAAVLTQVPVIYGIAYASMYTDIVVNVILMSILFTIIGIAIMKRTLNDIKPKRRTNNNKNSKNSKKKSSKKSKQKIKKSKR